LWNGKRPSMCTDLNETALPALAGVTKMPRI